MMFPNDHWRKLWFSLEMQAFGWEVLDLKETIAASGSQHDSHEIKLGLWQSYLTLSSSLCRQGRNYHIFSNICLKSLGKSWAAIMQCRIGKNMIGTQEINLEAFLKSLDLLGLWINMNSTSSAQREWRSWLMNVWVVLPRVCPCQQGW